jgi:nitroreductase
MAGWRTRLKALLPDFLQDPARRLADTLRAHEIARRTRRWAARDVDRYLRFEHSRNRSFSREQLRSKIIKSYHGIEKGLSLAEPRPGFGKALALTLKSQIEDYRGAFGFDDFLAAPVRVLEDYVRFQAGCGEALPLLSAFLAELAGDLARHQGQGGTEPVTAAGIRAASAVPLRPFLESRHSVRNFSGAAVDSALLAQACAMAQLAPSACNRQGGHAHCFNTPDLVAKVITLQPGNRGFGHNAGAVIVVTGDTRAYADAGERRQAIVDASLFAMTLVYALHSLGLGTCMLAWNASPEVDDALRTAARLADSEDVAMLIAVGHLPDTLKVPVSTRYPAGEVATLNHQPLSARSQID